MENLDIDGKDVLLSTIELNQACLMSDINKIISIAEKSILTKTGNSGLPWKHLVLLKNKASKDDLNHESSFGRTIHEFGRG